MFRLSHFFTYAATGLVGLAAITNTSIAHAEERSIIRNPGDHPDYSVEIEPHVAFGLWEPLYADNGIGLGARFSIPVVHNGFVSTINNNVAIGLGLDWLHSSYSWCGSRGRGYVGCGNDPGYSYNTVWLPVVMQWNFFLSTHWSVFGEPGLGIVFDSDNGACAVDARGVYYDCGHRQTRVAPTLFVGGRYHFSKTVALTGRLGFPYFSIGVSFFP